MRVSLCFLLVPGRWNMDRDKIAHWAEMKIVNSAVRIKEDNYGIKRERNRTEGSEKKAE